MATDDPGEVRFATILDTLHDHVGDEVRVEIGRGEKGDPVDFQDARILGVLGLSSQTRGLATRGPSPARPGRSAMTHRACPCASAPGTSWWAPKNA
jgi:hypothetical protein